MFEREALGYEGNASRLVVMRADGAAETCLGEGRAPDWSPVLLPNYAAWDGPPPNLPGERGAAPEGEASLAPAAPPWAGRAGEGSPPPRTGPARAVADGTHGTR